MLLKNIAKVFLLLFFLVASCEFAEKPKIQNENVGTDSTLIPQLLEPIDRIDDDLIPVDSVKY